MFYVGAVFIVVLLNLFLFLTLRERIYGYYAFYALTLSLYIVNLSGFIEYIFPNSFYSLVFLSPLSLTLLILFSKEILETYKYTPKIDKFLNFFAFIAFMLTVLIYIDIFTWFKFYNQFLVIVPFVILFATISAFKKGSSSAGYFTIFMVLYIISLFIMVLMSLGVIEYNIFTRYAFIYASLIELSFFSLVLANRFNKTKKEKEIVEVALKNTTEISRHDPLTGLYNRHYLDLYLKECFYEARKKKEDVCVIMLDIDKFKHVNDTYGHTIGDKVLSSISNIFIQNTRKNDVVARYGGEEFVIILSGTSLDNAQVIAEKIRANIEKLRIKYEDHKDFSVTISQGIALLQSEDTSLKSVIKRADKALYQSKNDGRNRVSISFK